MPTEETKERFGVPGLGVGGDHGGQEIRDPEGLGEVSKTATLGEEGGEPCAEGKMGKGGPVGKGNYW